MHTTRHLHKRITSWLLPLFMLGLTSCLSPKPPARAESQKAASAVSSHAKVSTTAMLPASPQSAAQERDSLYTLLAYSLVYKDWQTHDLGAAKRGHNIGCVLVNPAGQLVHAALNCNGRYKNGTQHGETRVMWQYQGQEKLYDLKGYTIYTTLEPCAMCSGMMVMQKVSRTIYGQTDLDFGKAIERLQLQSQKYPPYPRSKDLSSTPADHPIRVSIDKAYKRSYDSGKTSLTDWLLGDEARSLYSDARAQLVEHSVVHEENRTVLDSCLKILKDFDP